MASGSRGTVRVTTQERCEGLSLRMEEESDLTPLEDEVERPRTRKSMAPLKNAAVEYDQVPGEDRRTKHAKSRNTPRARKRTSSQVVENTLSEEVLPKKRKRACQPEPVYVIPDVEKKVTTFKGRLGTTFVCYSFFT